MTETTLLHGGVQDEQSAYVPPPAEVEAADPGQRRKMVLLAAVAGAVLVAIAAFFLLFHKSSTAGTSTGSGPAVAPRTVRPAAGAAPSRTVQLPPAFTGNVGRNPFLALVVPPVQGVGATAPATGSTSTAAAPTTTTTTAGTGSTSTTATTGTTTNAFCSGSASQGNLTPAWIELDSVFSGGGYFRVAYTNGCTIVWKAPFAGTATTFGKVFQLLALKGTVATVREADGQPFQVQQGYANRHFFG